jgi:hypothetical protein
MTVVEWGVVKEGVDGRVDHPIKSGDGHDDLEDLGG